MAQTKRKRQTKHRGNAAGVVEARGRTGRPPSAEEKKKQTRADAREARLSRKPTWRGSFTRAALAGGFMFVFIAFVEHSKKGGSAVEQGLLFAVLAIALYTPGGYYVETFLWRRRMAKRQPQKR